MHLYISYIVVEHLIKGTIEFTSMQRLIALKCLFLYTYNTFVTSDSLSSKPSLNVFSHVEVQLYYMLSASMH